ncbi:MAG TPA: flagellar hook capping FlgD N-terminal domain-containing protein [Verrucomicrobiae bacterium]|jgi:flagellar basal-body rod modification protein FlgD|nr:flagellar hook capping FlgD N-terminal domain-containing protein [Verrucomicrobiae bacterium]
MSTSISSNSSTPATGSQTLNQADFLKLLVTQMTSQDPLNPQSDTAFAAQLAQFSALQQTQTMSTDVQGLQANSLIGRTVSVVSSTNNSQSSTGVVTGVQYNSGDPQILVNGQGYDLTQLSSILPATTTTTP